MSKRTLIVMLYVFGLLLLQSAFLAVAETADSRITVRLIETIQKKNYDDFTQELAKDTMDVNQPTPTGKLPIIEAVKTKDVKFIDAMLQYGATVNVKEPGTGTTPIALAFQAGLVDISKLLLAYGADPTVAAKNSKKASDLITSNSIRELFAKWEKEGAMAFEDAPGSWVKAKDDEGKEYWFNKELQDGRWNMPPSCAWQRVEHKDAPPSYVNYVTGQTLHITPKALAWRKVRSEGTEIWYNWAANITQYEQPDEMPEYLLNEAANHVNVRWFNDKTQEYSWEDPKARTHWRAVPDGDRMYYYNVVSGESQWDIPDEMAWTKHEHDSGYFYHNVKTGESTWDVPDAEAWVRHDHDL